ncbi:cytochrome P450 [Actinophytocola sp.]|uniref:cytochrome P450 n=1 Tax=Actinophytocola sp. TaxID=1872138 RepID=UPI002EDA3871
MDTVSAPEGCPAFPPARRHAYEHPELYYEFQDHEPAAKVTLPTGDVVRLITRFEDAKQILIDRENIYSRKLLCEPDAPWFSTLRPPPGMLTTSDPPENTRLRRLAAGCFTARKVKAMEPRMQAVTDRLLDAMEDMTPPVNLVETLSLPVPIAMICQLLGVPPDGEALVHDWCNSLLTITADSPEELMAQQMKMAGYILELAEVKRKEPSDDLMGSLVAAMDEGKLDDGELIMLIMFLCIAGHETTLSMINGAVVTLLDNPEHKQRFMTDPSCVDAYVEELIRVNPIGDGGPLAIVTKDVEIGGTKIAAGEAVLVPVGAANRDHRRYENPGAFMPERDNRDHLGFGGGAHSCLGAPLARLELRIALTSLFKRFPTLRLAVDREELQLKPTMSLHTLHTLPMTW